MINPYEYTHVKKKNCFLRFDISHSTTEGACSNVRSREKRRLLFAVLSKTKACVISASQPCYTVEKQSKP